MALAKPKVILSFDEMFVGEPTTMPTGGSGFTTKGFTGPWKAESLFATLFQGDPQTLAEKGLKADMFKAMGQSGWYRYFWRDSMKAKAAGDKLELQYPMSQYWVFEIPTRGILDASDLDKLEAGFGSMINYDVQIASWTSWKHRHNYQMITLPSAISAMAPLFGYDVAPFEVPEILVSEDNFVATDENQYRLIGSIDPRTSADSPDYFKNSEFWKRRCEVWKSLGETNMEAYLQIGYKDPAGKPSKYAATSEKLSNLLRSVMQKWGKSFYMTVAGGLDPSVGGHQKDKEKDGKTVVGRRNTVPVVLRAWSTEQEAKDWVEAQKNATDEDGADNPPFTPDKPVVVNSNGAAMPPVPADYADMVDDFKSALITAAKEGSNGIEIAKLMGVTLAEVNTWRKFLGV